MAVRQNSAPMDFGATRRMDNRSVRTSGDAGVVIPVTVAPLLRGDSASGRVLIALELAEMPKPLENAVVARSQAWFVPRPSLPQFAGIDDYVHAWHGESVTRLGGGDYTTNLFQSVAGGSIAAAQSSEFFTSLGIVLYPALAINTDYIDAYNHIQNFRLASHSSKMTRYDYYAEDNTAALELKPAFWPRNRMTDIVPDYEQALVKGSLELDVLQGSIPITGLITQNASSLTGIMQANLEEGGTTIDSADTIGGDQSVLYVGRTGSTIWDDLTEAVAGDMVGQAIGVSLADIDKARTTQAFAKAQTAYAGSDFSGFNNDDVIIADLMQGHTVPAEMMQRPWLLDSKTVTFGMTERHATDGANLDDSVSLGSAQIALSINIPKAEYGGIMMTTVEVMPERLYERQRDEYLYCMDADSFPNALRDLQRTEPVDTVLNARVDQLHSSPVQTYGFEPMNAKWKREMTLLGGEFIQLTPGTPVTSARTAIWQADYVDPAFTSDNYLCPSPMPQDVFSVPANHIVNISVQQQLTITGITQFGDDLVEDNGEFLSVEAEQT